MLTRNVFARQKNVRSLRLRRGAAVEEFILDVQPVGRQISDRLGEGILARVIVGEDARRTRNEPFRILGAVGVGIDADGVPIAVLCRGLKGGSVAKI